MQKPSAHPPRRRNRIPLLLAFLLLISISFVTCLIVVTTDHGQVSASTVKISPNQNGASGNSPTAKHSVTPHSELSDDGFRRWLAAFVKVPVTSPEQGKWVAEGLALAKARRPQMENQIRSDPRRALAVALRFDEWAALPAEIQAEVEKPFSVTGAYTYYPICRDPGTPIPPGESSFYASLTLPDGSSLQAFPYGRRDGVFSKRALPMQGIALGGLAAMRDGPLQIVDAAELAVVRTLFPDGQMDMSHSLASGMEVSETATYAVVGGRLHAFAERAEAEKLDRELAELDAKPGPFAASSLLADSGYISTNGSFNLPQAHAQAAAQSASWTETKKRVLLIRVNFRDRSEEPVALEAVQSVMSQSSDMIRRMSYGKTWVEFDATANVYTLPNSLEYYSSAQHRLWGELEIDALNTFRERKSGIDSSINAGPVDPARGELGDYDIVGVYRVTAPGEGAGGVAGGSGFVIMGSWANTIRVFTHEWGHNYGLGHSSLWKTTDGSIAGEGETDEYGDPFDLMGDGRMPEGHFHPEGKVRLNWLPVERWEDASAGGSGTYRISRIDDTAAPTKLHAVRIARGGDGAQNGYYWIAHRGAFAENPQLSNGAYLIWQRPGMHRSWLLDTTPGSAGGTQDSALAMGRTFSDPQSHAFLTTVGAGGNGSQSYIDLQVNLGPFPNNVPPQASAIAGPARLQARSAVTTYSVTGSDANADPLAYSWDTGVSLLQSAPNSPTLQARWIVGGTYPLKVSVSDMKGGNVTTTKWVEVEDPLDRWKVGKVGRPVTMSEAQAGNGVMMGMGYWGELFRSQDGIKWSEIGHGTGLVHWTRLAFGKGVFVMSGHRSGETKARIAYSSDGRKWQMARLPKQVAIVKTVAYGAGKFVAAGERGVILSSKDGMTWKKTTVAGRPDFHQIAWNGKVWLATARNPVNNWLELVWTSPDAVTWKSRPNVGVDGQRILAHQGAFYYLSWWAGIKRSTDNGLSWHNAIMPSGTPWSVTRAGIADDGTMVAIGIAQGEPDAPRALLVSVDGLHWHRSTSNGAKSAVAEANNVGFIAGRMLILGNNGVVRYSSLFNSAPVEKSPEQTAMEDAAGSPDSATASQLSIRKPESPPTTVPIRASSTVLAFPLQTPDPQNGLRPAFWKVYKAKDPVTGLRHLELVVTKVPGVDYRRQVVEVSSNLMDWKSGVEHTTIIRNDPWMLTVRDKTPTTPEKGRYIRLRDRVSGWKP